MKNILATTILATLSPSFANTIYIGTNTGGNSESKGQTGKLGEPSNTVSTPTPICLHFAR